MWRSTGSILGPLLFLIYVNDLPNAVKGKTIIYADDTTLLTVDRSHTVLKTALQLDLGSVNDWFTANGLVLNRNKTQAVNFHSNYRSSNRACDAYLRSMIDAGESVVFLGLKMDSALTFRGHVSSVMSKLSKAYFVMLNLSRELNIKTLIMVYYGYVYSILNYAVMFWGNSVDAKRVFYRQKKILRTMVGAHSRSSCRPLFRSLRILTLPCIYIYSILMFLKLNRHYFELQRPNHQYHTRNTGVYNYPIHRTTMFENSPLYMGLKLHNGLPPDIRSEVNPVKFKGKLRTYLLDLACYSVDEFLEA